MKILLISIFSLTYTVIIGADSISQRVDQITSLISSNPDSAYHLATDLKEESEKKGHDYGIIQSNFILAYINQKTRGDFGKAIIYYLEAIRFAKNSHYDDRIKNLISLHKNCGVIYRKFKAFDLALKYYSKGLDYAEETNDHSQIDTSNLI